MVLRAILITLSLVLLAAHFLRAGHLFLTVLCTALPFLLLIKKRWVLILLQLVAYLGTLAWIHTAVQIVRRRLFLGIPFRGAVLILGSVAIFTLISGLLLNSKKIKDGYL